MTPEISPIDAILDQLKIIQDTNRMIEISKEMSSSLMVRQYEHLKKELTKNLFEMLEKSYQITIPIVSKKEAA